ncbi:MAG: hypothetical protein Kow0029_15890 [Candidatus Rifleibacteriota bacterium]
MLKTGNAVKIVLFSLVAVCLFFTGGCSGGSNNPVSTELSTGAGYKIKLASSLENVTAGGSSIITAVIYEPDGSPVRDNEEVLFASGEGGSFSESTVTTKNGTASTIYTAGEASMKYDNITASCRGATAFIQVWILPATF